MKTGWITILWIKERLENDHVEMDYDHIWYINPNKCNRGKRGKRKEEKDLDEWRNEYS